MPNATFPIFYDSRIKNIDKEIKEILKALVRGEATPGARVEKLINHDVYSLRINDKGRILFTYSKVNSLNSLVVLEVLENHEYDKSKFLKKNVLKKYLKNTQGEINRLVEDDDFEEAIIPQELKQPNANIIFEEAYENKHEYIILDESQKVIFNSSTPLLVEGPPGSGKTLLSQGLIKQALENGAKKVLYVTPSSNLARTVLRELATSPEYDETKVDVVAYDQLLEPNLQPDGIENLKTWWKNIEVKKTDKSKLANWSKNINAVYEELKIISGSTRKEYCSEQGIGKKQTFLGQNQSDRQLLFSIYQSWMQYLNKNHIHLRDFYIFKPEQLRTYDLIVVDESQYLSHASIHNLLEMTNNNNIVICSDRRQNPLDEMQKNIHLTSMINQRIGRPPNELQLSAHYRCPENIMAFAKVFNDTRTLMAKNQKSELKVADSKMPGGVVQWIEPNNKNEIAQIIERLRNDANACVVAPENLKKEAKSLGLSNVLTPEEVIGLEFATVILYKTLATPQMRKVNQWLEKSKPQTEELHAAADLSANFISATRATECLIMVQNSEEYGLGNIIKALKATMTHLEKIESPETSPVHKSTTQEWEVRAKEAAEQGHMDRAKDILSTHLNITDEALQKAQIQSWLGEDKASQPTPAATRAQPKKAKPKQHPPSNKEKTQRRQVSQQVKSTSPSSIFYGKRYDAKYTVFIEAITKLLKFNNINPLRKEFLKKHSAIKPEYFLAKIDANTDYTGLLYMAAHSSKEDCSDIFNKILAANPPVLKAADFAWCATRGINGGPLFLFALAALNGYPQCFMMILKHFPGSLDVNTFTTTVLDGEYKGKSILTLLCDASLKGDSSCLNEVLRQYSNLEANYVNTQYPNFEAALHHALDGNFEPLRNELNKDKEAFMAHFTYRIQENCPESTALFSLSALSDYDTSDFLNEVLTVNPSGFKATDFTGQASQYIGVAQGKSVLWMLAILYPKIFLKVLEQYHFDADAFSAKAQAGVNIGQNILWVTAYNAFQDSPECFMEIMRQYPGEFKGEDFSSQGQVDLNKGISALWWLAVAVADGHPEFLLEVLKQYPNKFKAEDFTTNAQSGPRKDMNALMFLCEAAAYGRPACLNEVIRQYPSLEDEALVHKLRFSFGNALDELLPEQSCPPILNFQRVTSQMQRLSLDEAPPTLMTRPKRNQP